MKTTRSAGLSRRAFVRGSAAGAAAPLFLAGAVPSILTKRAHAVPKDDPDVLRVGLVGCGGRGTGAAFQALQAEPGTVVLTALADLFPDKIDRALGALRDALGEEQAARLQVDPEHRFTGFDAWQRLLASDVDVVLLATPPHFRPAMLAGAIGAGKHVFCEKPMAVDAPGVRSVLASAARAREERLSLVSGFCWRYDVRHRAIYERIHEGALGDLRAIYSTYLSAPLATHARQSEWSDMEWQVRNWFHFLWLAGDHVVEQACHSLDKMAWAMRDVPPLSVTAMGGRQARDDAPETGNVYDHFSATFEYPGGVKGFHACRQMDACTQDNSDWVMGAKGVATINGWAPRHGIEGEEPWEYTGEGNDMYQQEHDELFASIRAGEPMNDGTWMSHSTMLAIMTRMSAYTGQTITWEEALASEERLGPTTYALADLETHPVAIPGKTPFF